MFNDFPRKMGFPEQVTVYDRNHMLRLVNGGNGHVNIYTSVFSDSQKIFGNLDKVVFDIDDCSGSCDECNESKKRKCSIGAIGCTPSTFNSFDSVMMLHEHFMKEGIKHVIGFSGGGYHVYASVLSVPLRNPNPALKNYTFKLTKALNIKCDTSVFEIARIMRFPGTYNVKRRKWFVWCTEEDILKGDEHIRYKAERQQIEPPYTWGARKLNLQEYDNANLDAIGNFQRTLDADAAGIKIEHINVAPCIQALLQDPFMNYKDRYHCYLYFKEKGLTMGTTIKIMQDALSPEKFLHSVNDEHQPQHIWKNSGLFFPKCRRLEQEGYCVKQNCEQKDSIYL